MNTCFTKIENMCDVHVHVYVFPGVTPSKNMGLKYVSENDVGSEGSDGQEVEMDLSTLLFERPGAGLKSCGFIYVVAPAHMY